MNKLIIVACLLLIVSFGCSKDDNSSYGQITGSDARDCACCGGWFIKINSNTYRFYNLPEGSNINLETATFPIGVYIDWIKDRNSCLGDEILISEIIRNKEK